MFLGCIRPETMAELEPHLTCENRSPFAENRLPGAGGQNESAGGRKGKSRLTGKRQTLRSVENVPSSSKHGRLLPNPAVSRSSLNREKENIVPGDRNTEGLADCSNLFVSD